MNREARCNMGRETVDAIESRYFMSVHGERVSLAEDLERLCRDTTVISAEDHLPLPPLSSHPLALRLEFKHCTTLEACQLHRESKTAALNFASSKNPGGGFRGGSQAQEESIARSSTLYASLTTPVATALFYDPHRQIKPNDGIYTNTIILSPHVLIFRDEFTGKTLASPLEVTIVTCPAVNAGQTRRTRGTNNVIDQLIRDTMKSRIERILAVCERAQTETVILGAYGCGVFKNKVDDVAKVFRAVLEERQWRFREVVFAIPDASMLKTFKDEFGVCD